MPRRNEANARRGPRVLVSIRVSETYGREETLTSPEIQWRTVEAFLARDGLKVVPSATVGLGDGSGGLGDVAVVELDRTGRESTKRKIGAMTRVVAENRADGIVVMQVDRWGRDLGDSLFNIRNLQDVGGFIASATEDLSNLKLPMGVMNLQLALMMAEMRSNEIGAAWGRTYDFRKSTGRTVTRTPRLGYLRAEDITDDFRLPDGVRRISRGGKPALERVDPEGEVALVDYVPDPQVAPWVARAVEWYVNGLSMRKVVQRLDAAGVRVATTGNRLTAPSLRKTLDGGFQAGLIVDRSADKEVFHPGGHERIITRELFDAYRARRDEKVAPRTKHAPYRLARLFECGSCGRPMRKQKYTDGIRGDIMKCNCFDKAYNLSPCPRPAFVNYDRSEAEVLEWLRAHATGQEELNTQMARAGRAVRAERDVARMKRELEDRRRMLSVLVDKNLRNIITDEAYMLKEKEIKTSIESLSVAIEAARTEVVVNTLPNATVFGALIAGWERMDVEIVNEAVRKVIRKIVVHRAPKRGVKPTLQIIGRWEEPSTPDR